MRAYRYGPALRVPGRGLVAVSAWRNSEGAWVITAHDGVAPCDIGTRRFYGYTLRQARRAMVHYLAGGAS